MIWYMIYSWLTPLQQKISKRNITQPWYVVHKVYVISPLILFLSPSWVLIPPLKNKKYVRCQIQHYIQFPRPSAHLKPYAPFNVLLYTHGTAMLAMTAHCHCAYHMICGLICTVWYVCIYNMYVSITGLRREEKRVAKNKEKRHQRYQRDERESPQVRVQREKDNCSACDPVLQGKRWFNHSN